MRQGERVAVHSNVDGDHENHRAPPPSRPALDLIMIQLMYTAKKETATVNGKQLGRFHPRNVL